MVYAAMQTDIIATKAEAVAVMNFLYRSFVFLPAPIMSIEM